MSFSVKSLFQIKASEIGSLVVEINNHSQYIGSSLFEQACPWVKKSGEMKLRVCCADQRIHAHKFYLVQGMSQIKIQYTFDNLQR